MASRASTKSKASKSAARGKSAASPAGAKAKVKAGASKTGRAAPKAAPIKSAGKAGKAVGRTALIAKSAQKTAATKAAKNAAKSARKTAIKVASRKRDHAAAMPAPAPRYHTVTPFLNVKGALDAIDFYKRAFGAEERMRMPNPDGTIMHAELVIGDSTIMLSDASRSPESRSSIHLSVDDCDALFERAVSAGGLQRMAPQDMFWGDRYGQVEDPFGNLWAISTHKEDVPAEELSRRAAEFAAPPPAETVTDLGIDPA
jgi:PhnB protein